jgi:hypothetical protein
MVQSTSDVSQYVLQTGKNVDEGWRLYLLIRVYGPRNQSDTPRE